MTFTDPKSRAGLSERKRARHIAYEVTHFDLSELIAPSLMKPRMVCQSTDHTGQRSHSRCQYRQQACQRFTGGICAGNEAWIGFKQDTEHHSCLSDLWKRINTQRCLEACACAATVEMAGTVSCAAAGKLRSRLILSLQKFPIHFPSCHRRSR